MMTESCQSCEALTSLLVDLTIRLGRAEGRAVQAEQLADHALQVADAAVAGGRAAARHAHAYERLVLQQEEG
jgi:hypothetical protein